VYYSFIDVLAIVDAITYTTILNSMDLLDLKLKEDLLYIITHVRGYFLVSSGH